jgi:hypothetical protein
MPAEDITTEESATTTVPSESLAEEIIVAEAKKRQEGDEDIMTSLVAVKTTPGENGNVENPATSNDKNAEAKNQVSAASATEASKESVAQNGTNEGGSKEKDEKVAEENGENTDASVGPVVSATKRTRPPYKYDPEKVTLRFLFANRDGLTVTVECKPGDTVGEVKGQLLSVWPEGKYLCSPNFPP